MNDFNDQRWVLDALLDMKGWDVLHPQVGMLFAELGYNPADIDRIFDMVKSTEMMPKAWGQVGSELFEKATYWEGRNYVSAAQHLYRRAALIFARSKYALPQGGKPIFLEKQRESLDKWLELMRSRVSCGRISIPFESGRIEAVEVGPRDSEPNTTIILLPGMDGGKEEWLRFMVDSIVSRGWRAVALDGPGQGETLASGVHVTVSNYEGAVSALIDSLEKADKALQRIFLFGISMGSYWGVRAAATDHRITAAATALACYGPKELMFNEAQPRFRSNFKRMTGVPDDNEFDALVKSMDLKGLVHDVAAPLLMVTGEFDELTTLDDTLSVYAEVPPAKELWIYEWEFHPIGPPANEWLHAALDWLDRAEHLQSDSQYDRQIYVRRDGDYVETTSGPPWRLGE